jgi:RNA polymerase sigma factor (sigma-70 family)
VAALATSTDGLENANVAVELRQPASHPAPERLDLETVYRIRRPEMIRYLARLGVDLVEAEDITQEVFLQLFASTKPQKRLDNVLHWALACAKNMAISRYRRSRRERLAPAALWKLWEETLSDGAPGAEARAREQEDRRRLAQGVAQLSALEQQCLVFRSRGVPFREIASALGLPMQSAVYTTDVAIRKLQRKLKCAER